MTSKFRDSQNKLITQGLFLELTYSPHAIYTLQGEDREYNGKKYLSIKKLYLECRDPTEYTFATKYFESWQHWLRICNNQAMVDHIQIWRDELEVLLVSEAVKQQQELAAKGNYNATKWLSERGWMDKTKGRPSKASVAREREKQARIQDLLEEDAIRVGIVH